MNVDITKQILTSLLADGQPEIGARLKQRLNNERLKRGLGILQEREFGCSKFSEYLRKAHGELLFIQGPNGLGDILVSLASESQGRAIGAVTPSIEKQPHIRSELWQAFLNPDPRRSRFLNRESGHVIHFRPGESTDSEREFHARAAEFVEVKPIPASEQHGWMRAYVASISVGDSERGALNALVEQPYTSQLNATFTGALKEHAVGWKAYRLKKILEEMERWAKSNSLPRELLFPSTQRTLPKATALDKNNAGQARAKVVQLLTLLDDDDVAQFVLPTVLATIHIRTKVG